MTNFEYNSIKHIEKVYTRSLKKITCVSIQYNMKRVFLLLLITTSISFGQTKYDKYEELISKANYYRGIEDFGQAIVSYREALEILTPNSSTPFFNLAECALHFKNIPLADEWIRKGISKGGAQIEYLRKYKGFKNIQEKGFYKVIILDYNSLRQQYFSTLENVDVYMEIEEMITKDQLVRKMDTYISDEVKEDTKVLIKKSHYKIIKKVDSLNIDRLIQITKEFGWQERAWILLWHQRGSYGEDNYIWNYFRPLINKEIDEGKISRSFWAAFDQFKEIIKTGKLETIQVINSKQKK